MTTKLLPLFAGAALLAGVGAANAGEPITLTDAQMDDVTAGGSFEFVQVKFAIFSVASFVSGNSATAQADAVAIGNDTHSQTHTFSFADPFTSFSQSISISLAD
jgi:hypothetical protein